MAASWECPPLPMISLSMKESNRANFQALKPLIASQYEENAESFANEIQQLNQLRDGALRPSRDYSGCNILRRYYAQIHLLKSRFPQETIGPIPIVFTWKDIYTGEEYQQEGLHMEMASVLYNIGALHSQLGGKDGRHSEQDMKEALTHYQCSAGAYTFFSEYLGGCGCNDITPQLIEMYKNLMLGQAQECIVEKSLKGLSKVKNLNISKIAMKVSQYYQSVVLVLESEAGASVVKKHKDWTKLLQIKCSYYSAIAHLYQANSMEEQANYGYMIAFQQLALDKVKSIGKLPRGTSDTVKDAIKNLTEFLTLKLQESMKQNEQVFHELVPSLETLEPAPGVELVKPVIFQPSDPKTTGSDIFARLIPMRAYEAASIYSEEKAKLLRSIVSSVDEKDEELNKFMTSLNIDEIDRIKSDPPTLPPELMSQHRQFQSKGEAIRELQIKIEELMNLSQRVEKQLSEISQRKEDETKEESEFQERHGTRPESQVCATLWKELESLLKYHKQANKSNTELSNMFTQHSPNLLLLAGKTSSVVSAIPTLNLLDVPEDSRGERWHMLLGKVNEMKEQRQSLVGQLRDQMNSDDILHVVIGETATSQETVIEEHVKRHREMAGVIRQNLTAQENILQALTEANAKQVKLRQASQSIQKKQEEWFISLAKSAGNFTFLQSKIIEGLGFYSKLAESVARLHKRCMEVCNTRRKERNNIERRSPLLERSNTSPGPKGPITPSPGPTAPTATRPIPSPGPPGPISGPTIQVSDSPSHIPEHTSQPHFNEGTVQPPIRPPKNDNLRGEPIPQEPAPSFLATDNGDEVSQLILEMKKVQDQQINKLTAPTSSTDVSTGVLPLSKGSLLDKPVNVPPESVKPVGIVPEPIKPVEPVLPSQQNMPIIPTSDSSATKLSDHTPFHPPLRPVKPVYLQGEPTTSKGGQHGLYVEGSDSLASIEQGGVVSSELGDTPATTGPGSVDSHHHMPSLAIVASQGQVVHGDFHYETPPTSDPPLIAQSTGFSTDFAITTSTNDMKTYSQAQSFSEPVMTMAAAPTTISTTSIMPPIIPTSFSSNETTPTVSTMPKAIPTSFSSETTPTVSTMPSTLPTSFSSDEATPTVSTVPPPHLQATPISSGLDNLNAFAIIGTPKSITSPVGGVAITTPTLDLPLVIEHSTTLPPIVGSFAAPPAPPPLSVTTVRSETPTSAGTTMSSLEDLLIRQQETIQSQTKQLEEQKEQLRQQARQIEEQRKEIEQLRLQQRLQEKDKASTSSNQTMLMQLLQQQQELFNQQQSQMDKLNQDGEQRRKQQSDLEMTLRDALAQEQMQNQALHGQLAQQAKDVQHLQQQLQMSGQQLQSIQTQAQQYLVQIQERDKVLGNYREEHRQIVDNIEQQSRQKVQQLQQQIQELCNKRGLDPNKQVQTGRLPGPLPTNLPPPLQPQSRQNPPSSQTPSHRWPPVNDASSPGGPHPPHGSSGLSHPPSSPAGQSRPGEAPPSQQPAHPQQPSHLTQQPVQPGQQPAKPVHPGHHIQQPGVPIQPGHPGQQPVIQGQPGQQPVIQGQPGQQPVIRGQPGHPGQQSVIQGQPGHPGQQPVIQGQPGHSGQQLPVHPGHPQQPVRPVHPGHQQPVLPVRPPQPDGQVHSQSGGPVYPQSGGPVYPQSGGPVNPQSSRPVHPQSGGPVNPQSGGPVHPQSGRPVHPQSGGTVNPQPSGPVHPQSSGPIHSQPVGPVNPRPIHSPGGPPGPQPGTPVRQGPSSVQPPGEPLRQPGTFQPHQNNPLAWQQAQQPPNPQGHTPMATHPYPQGYPSHSQMDYQRQQPSNQYGQNFMPRGGQPQPSQTPSSTGGHQHYRQQ